MLKVVLKALGYAVLGAALGAAAGAIAGFDYSQLGVIGGIVAGLAKVAAEFLQKLADKYKGV
jgi:hypothetical protein